MSDYKPIPQHILDEGAIPVLERRAHFRHRQDHPLQRLQCPRGLCLQQGRVEDYDRRIGVRQRPPHHRQGACQEG